MSLIEEFSGAILTAVGLGLAAIIGLLVFRLLSLAASGRRMVSKQHAAEVAEDKLMAHLRADGYSPEDARAAVQATRDRSGDESQL